MRLSALLPLAAVLVLFLSAPAEARSGWEHARWGMTRAEILAAYPAAQQAPTYLTLPGSYTVFARHFSEIRFGFDNAGRLRSIGFLRGDTDFAALQREMVEGFGPGIVFSQSGGGTAVYFPRAQLGDDVTLSYGGALGHMIMLSKPA